MPSKSFKSNHIFEKYHLKKGKRLRKADGMAIRSDIFVCFDKHGKKYAAKVFMSKDENAHRRFVREVKVIKKLRVTVGKYKSWLPKIKWYCLYGPNPYYIYEYVESEQLGQFVKDFGIKWGRFNDKNFKTFIEFFDIIAKKGKEFNDISLSNWGSRTAMKEVQFYLENVPDLLPGYLYDRVRTFLDKKRSLAFKNRELSHRDLYPENILIKENQTSTFTFLDWEHFGEVPVGFNAAFLYLLFWREDYWQAKIISHFHNKYVKDDDDKALNWFYMSFRFCLVVLGIRFLYQLETYSDRSATGFDSVKLAIRKYIEDALMGEIIKPVNVKFLVGSNDIDRVAGDYNIGKVSKYYVFYASKGNTVVKVDTPKRTFVFRFYSVSRSKALIKRELNIFKHLNACGVRTYEVIPSQSGELYSTYKMYGRNRRVAVLTYVKGGRIKQKWANERAAVSAGRQLKMIHEAGVIHGDFSKENVLYQKSKVTGVIDFEWGRFTSSKRAHESDLAKAIALWLIDIRERGIPNDVFVIQFLRGYVGKTVKGRFLKRIINLAIIKVAEEKAVFLTTVDKSNQQNPKLGRRFDKAINVLKGLGQQ